MEIKQLEDRIAKKKSQIEKIDKRIAKWEKAKSVEAFKKEYDWLGRGGYFYNSETDKYDKPFETFMSERWDDYVANCDRELKYANRDKEDALLTLDKYKNQLNMEIAKQDKLNAPRIQVIMDFLNDWQDKVNIYIHKNVELIPKYYAASKDETDYSNNNRWKVYRGELSKEEFNAEDKRLRQIAKDINDRIDPLTWEVYNKKFSTMIDETKLKEILDKEADDKYLYMIELITAKVGEITNASELEIGVKGEIDGYIIGTKGKVHVWTVGAGGYNIQRFHFRTLVKPVK